MNFTFEFIIILSKSFKLWIFVLQNKTFVFRLQNFMAQCDTFKGMHGHEMHKKSMCMFLVGCCALIV